MPRGDVHPGRAVLCVHRLVIGSLFSGIGGLELGLEWAGLGEVAWQVEIDPWCRGVLAMHWPRAARHADVRRVGARNLESVEVICGGFPCQDISVAGKNAGIDGARSGLWREYLRIVGELRPRIVVVENVRALVSRGLDRVTADLDAAGYRVEARIIAAADVGAPHRRERLFLVAHSDCGGREEPGGERGSRGLAVPCGNEPRVAYPHGERVRQQQQREPRRHADDLRDRGQGEPVDHGEGRGRHPEPGVDRDAHGLPARLDRWPARPGDPPALWEPARSVSAYSPTREARVRALGNAVVPQVARLVGERVRELLWLDGTGPPR